jgi:leucyl aminopeptidase
VPVFKGGIEGPGAEPVLSALALDGFPVTPEFRGDIGQHLLIGAPGLPAGGVLLIGLGRMDEVDPARLRRAAGVAAGAARGARKLATTLAEVHSTSAAVEAVAEGLQLGAYEDRRFRSDAGKDASRLREAVILVPSSRVWEARLAIQRANVYAQATLAARDLVNLPPAQKRPPELAEALVELASACCSAEVRDEERLAAEGFGGLLAVGRGSAAPPRFVELRYEPPNPLGHIVLVGKGITFDTGGLSLKRGTNMDLMKSDMAGAAAVAAACSVLAELGVRLQVTGLLALAENMPGGDAQRPGDVITHYGGRTVEVLNTDAEGRLVLADALAYGAQLQPDAMVDVATLTGMAIVALGTYAAAAMGNDEALVEALVSASKVAGEDVWPLPLWSRLEPLLDSPVADLNNLGDGGGRRRDHGRPVPEAVRGRRAVGASGHRRPGAARRQARRWRAAGRRDGVRRPHPARLARASRRLTCPQSARGFSSGVASVGCTPRQMPELSDRLVAAAKAPDPQGALTRVAGSDAHGILRALASLQGGQFATAQAGALGLTPAAVKWLGAAGETLSLRRGVWRFRSAVGIRTRRSPPGWPAGPMRPSLMRAQACATACEASSARPTRRSRFPTSATSDRQGSPSTQAARSKPLTESPSELSSTRRRRGRFATSPMPAGPHGRSRSSRTPSRQESGASGSTGVPLTSRTGGRARDS